MTWRIVALSPELAHYFEQGRPLCFGLRARKANGAGPEARNAWTVHQHAGRVPQCATCRAELGKPRGPK